MNIFRLVCLLVLVLCPASAMAQTNFIGGRVVGEDHTNGVPANWAVVVSGQGQQVSPLPGSPTYSMKEIYFFFVPQNARVRLLFEAPYYRSQATQWIAITASTGAGYRGPDVTLTRISSPGSGTGSKPQGRAALRRELDEQAEFAKASNSRDVFQFNLEVYGAAYADILELQDEIVQFKSSTKYKELVPPSRERWSPVYKEMINRLQNKPARTNPEDLFDLIRARSISPPVRSEATRSLALIDLQPNAKNTYSEFFLKEINDPANDLWLPSYFALAKLGNAEQRRRVISDMKSSDLSRVFASMAAIKEAGLKESTSELVGLVQSTSSSQVRLTAIQTLAMFPDETTLPAFKKALELDNPESVRIEAAMGLRPLNHNREARLLLTHTAQEDTSTRVKQAAEASLRPR